jgi:hypothetical protein
MGMLPLRACALAFCASCLAFAFTPASTLIAPDGATYCCFYDLFLSCPRIE